MLSLALSGCQKMDKDIVGSWYCEDNNILLTFYEDQTLDRDLVDFESEKDGTYGWSIDRKSTLVITDSDDETILSFDYDSDWNLDNRLELDGNIYENVIDKEVSSKDASSSFYEECPDLSCVVFFHGEVTEDEMMDFQKQLEKLPIVKDTIYTSAEEAWEEFKDSYFEEDADAIGFTENPLKDSANIEVYVETPMDLEEILSYIEDNELTRKINSNRMYLVPDEPLL